MTTANYQGPTGNVGSKWPREVVYRAWDALPLSCRRRLAEATMPLCPVAVLDFVRRKRALGLPEAAVEGAVLANIELTEKHAADALERERATWTLGQDMAASMKAAHQRRLGRSLPPAP